MPQGLVSLLWFCAILALIPACLWLLKRTPLGGAAATAAGTLKTVATLPLSTSQRLVTVEVGRGDERRWLVLGVTPSSISTLHTLVPGPDDVVPAATPLPPTFQAVFARLRQNTKPGGPDAR